LRRRRALSAVARACRHRPAAVRLEHLQAAEACSARRAGCRERVCPEVLRTAQACSARRAGRCERGAQGRSPFPYALAELVDNALRATKGNQGARRIEITLASAGGAGAPRAGLITVWDNGCGMSTRELNDWAVMNLGMADRGLAPGAAAAGAGGGQAAERFLTSDLSFFGVRAARAAPRPRPPVSLGFPRPAGSGSGFYPSPDFPRCPRSFFTRTGDPGSSLGRPAPRA